MFVRNQANDPLTVALTACGASEATRIDFRFLGVDRELHVPLFPKHYEVCTLPASPAPAEGIYYWRIGEKCTWNLETVRETRT